MSNYKTAAVPFVMHGNRQILTREQLENEPYLADFIASFPVCFEHDPMLCVFYFWPEGNSPAPIDPRIFRRLPRTAA